MSAKLIAIIRFIVAYTPFLWVKAPRAVGIPKDPNSDLESYRLMNTFPLSEKVFVPSVAVIT